jgi:hypothetical protein
MDMVFHHLHGINLQIIRGRHLVKEILDRLGHLPDQQHLAVLGCLDNMILQIINGMSTCFVGHTEIVAALRAARFPPHSKLWGTQRDFSWKRFEQGVAGVANQGPPIEDQRKLLPTRYTDCPLVIAHISSSINPCKQRKLSGIMA